MTSLDPKVLESSCLSVALMTLLNHCIYLFYVTSCISKIDIWDLDWLKISGLIWTWQVSVFYFSDSIDSAVEKYGVQKISLLRNMCLKCGVQILLREYNLESKNKPIFYDDDIINIYPIVKHIHPKVHVFSLHCKKLKRVYCIMFLKRQDLQV